MINVTFSYNAQTSQTFRYKGNTKIKVPCNKFCKKIGIKISSVYFILNGINKKNLKCKDVLLILPIII